MDYLSKPPVQPKQEPVTYELKKDVTGEPPVMRGVQILKDTTGHKATVPFPPNPKCKKCRGLGFVGIDVNHKVMILCKKCYPHAPK